MKSLALPSMEMHDFGELDRFSRAMEKKPIEVRKNVRKSKKKTG